MLNPRHLLRAKRWAQNPPPWWRVKLVFGVIVLALVIAGVERLGIWPDWAAMEWSKARF